jgi:hypothetical protein
MSKFLPQKWELLGAVLIAVGIECIVKQRIQNHDDLKIWGEAAEAEEAVEARLRSQN